MFYLFYFNNNKPLNFTISKINIIYKFYDIFLSLKRSFIVLLNIYLYLLTYYNILNLFLANLIVFLSFYFY